MNKLTTKMFIIFSVLVMENLPILADENDTAAALLYFMSSGNADCFSITNAGPSIPVTIEDIEWNYSNNTQNKYAYILDFNNVLVPQYGAMKCVISPINQANTDQNKFISCGFKYHYT